MFAKLSKQIRANKKTTCFRGDLLGVRTDLQRSALGCKSKIRRQNSLLLDKYGLNN